MTVAIDNGPIPFDTYSGMDSPQLVIAKLTEIERDLALRQNTYERAASEWFKAKREQARDYARALITSTQPSVTAQKAEADLAAYATPGAEYEAEFEAIRAVLKVLETRASVCQSILKAQGRA